MSDVDDVTAAADMIEHRIGLATPVADRLDHATREQLTALMRGGIGEPEVTKTKHRTQVA